jgi:hypothetical protein
MAGLNSNGNGDRSRLVGWLVSYGLDSQGASYEIRAGRLFVSSAPAGDVRTISVSENTVSSPHLAVSASPKHQVLIQDIFSEHGTYLTKAGSDKEQKVSGPTLLSHGDWVRIGERTRFQVCLIETGKREALAA